MTNTGLAGPIPASSRSGVADQLSAFPSVSTLVRLTTGTGVPAGPAAAIAGCPAAGAGNANVSGAWASEGRTSPAGGTVPIGSGPVLVGSLAVPMLRPWSASTMLPQATDTEPAPAASAACEDTHNGKVSA